MDIVEAIMCGKETAERDHQLLARVTGAVVGVEATVGINPRPKDVRTMRVPHIRIVIALSHGTRARKLI